MSFWANLHMFTRSVHHASKIRVLAAISDHSSLIKLWTPTNNHIYCITFYLQLVAVGLLINTQCFIWDGAIPDITNINTVFLHDTFGPICDFWSVYTMYVDRSDDIKAGMLLPETCFEDSWRKTGCKKLASLLEL
jgi:hypothetical protein